MKASRVAAADDMLSIPGFMCRARCARGLGFVSGQFCPGSVAYDKRVFDEASCCVTEGRQGYDPALQANRGGKCRKLSGSSAPATSEINRQMSAHFRSVMPPPSV